MNRRSKGGPERGAVAASFSLRFGQNSKASPAEVQPQNRWQSAAVCVFLALAVWVVFGQTRHFEFVNYDDNVFIYENPNVVQGLSWQGVGRAFTQVDQTVWFPVTTISEMLDCQLYGLNPGGHHLTNVLLHAATAILLFLVLRKMTGALWPAAFVAAVFAIHPLRVESVAWVTERKDVLSGLFFMLTLWTYACYAHQSKFKNPKSKIWYGLALLYFALGLMSKPMLVTVPFVLLLLDYWPLRRLKPAATTLDYWPLFVEKVPFLLLAVAASMVTLATQKMKVQQVQDSTPLWRIENASLAYVDYIGHMLYPAGLAVAYSPPGQALPMARVGWSVLLLLLISAGAAAGRRKHPYLLLGWLWYLGMLVPVIDFMQAGDEARADRYTYLPQIGLYILVAWGAAEWSASWRYHRGILGGAATAILAGLMVMAHRQTTYWKDSISLWQHTFACTPVDSRNSTAQNNLGVALAAEGKWPEAVQHCERALQLNPDYAESHNNLGNALAAEGRLDEAIGHYQRALELKPDFAEAENALGNALTTQGKVAEGIKHCERALQINPDYAEAHNNLGIALADQGKLEEAKHEFERALQLKPDLARAQNNLGNLLATQGKLDEAVEHYEQALRLDPDYAEGHCNLGDALAGQGKLEEASQHYKQALQLKPDYAEAQGNLGNALAAQGKLDKARQQLRQALNLATAQNNTVLADAIRVRLKSLQAAPPQTQTP